MRRSGLRLQARAIERARRRQQQRRVVIGAAVLLTAVLVIANLFRTPAHHVAANAARSLPPSAPSSVPASGPAPLAAASPGTFPTDGPGAFTFAAGSAAVIGSSGVVLAFHVAVENKSGQSAAAFATDVEQILADQRGWTAAGDVRFQQVAQSATASFTIYLATANTSSRICDAGGVHTSAFISCRLPGQLVINLSRWLTGVPEYPSLADYRAYAINHELGRELGHPLEACPGSGQPAPVMMQQSLGLNGCTPYAWPFRDGTAYHGPALP